MRAGNTAHYLLTEIFPRLQRGTREDLQNIIFEYLGDLAVNPESAWRGSSGDELLLVVARILSQSPRREEIIGRLLRIVEETHFREIRPNLHFRSLQTLVALKYRANRGFWQPHYEMGREEYASLVLEGLSLFGISAVFDWLASTDYNKAVEHALMFLLPSLVQEHGTDTLLSFLRQMRDAVDPRYVTVLLEFCRRENVSLLNELSSDSFSRNYYGIGLQNVAERARALAEESMPFRRQGLQIPKIQSLNAILSNMDSTLHRLVGEGVDLVIQPSKSSAYVRVDAPQIEQVILNLALNAREAMPHGGKLSLEAVETETVVDDPFTSSYRLGAMRRYIMLVVSDTGSGMDDATRERIFDPFFTTKNPGMGAGLGLAIASGIIRDHGGFIRVDSQPGKGSRFKIYLPHAEDLENLQRQTILMVEDDVTVRDLAMKTFRSEGYEVLEARSGAEALEIAEQYKEPIQLLMMDLVMPQVSGLELVERLATQHPETKLFVLSGSRQDEASAVRLVAAIRRVLSGSSPQEPSSQDLTDILGRKRKESPGE
jgi:signal transduction histidine kinase/CheY-like chemotaxis protein